MIFHRGKIKISSVACKSARRRCGRGVDVHSIRVYSADVISHPPRADSYRTFLFISPSFIVGAGLLWWGDVKCQRGTFRRYFAFLLYVEHTNHSPHIFLASHSRHWERRSINKQQHHHRRDIPFGEETNNMFAHILPPLLLLLSRCVFTLLIFSSNICSAI